MSNRNKPFAIRERSQESAMLPNQPNWTSPNKHLSPEAYQRLTHLEAVNRISVALRVAETLETMLPILAAETLAVIDAAAVTIWLHDAARNELCQVAASGFPNLRVRLKPGEGIAGQVFLSGQAHISREFKTDPRTHEAVRAQVPPNLAGAALPIRTTRETVGVLFVSVLQPRELSPEQVYLLTTIAEIAGIAIQRMQLHELTECRLRRLASVQTVHLAISSSLDLRVTLNILLDQVLNQLQGDAADILLFNPHTQKLEYAAGRGLRGAVGERAVQLGEGIAGRAALERETIIVPDVTAAQGRSGTLGDETFAACLAVPLMARGQLKGVLEIFRRTPHDPDQEWLDFLQTLAELAAIAINNAAQFETLGRVSAELGIAFDALIERWARALEMLEREPPGHAARVAEMTLRLAQATHIPEAQRIHIRRGALLHDIGKLNLPDSVLLKPERLNAKEWAEMRKHPVYAYELLAPIEYLKPALAIPYCHHEKWDGTGYPNRLAGQAIPLEARLFAVVDVWDALRTARPYHTAWPPAKILKRIQTLSGTQFDPKAVEAFLELVTAMNPL
jgi:HD-GYP domain-containing protein (c-di-GMP phosphodiesterase class II)